MGVMGSMGVLRLLRLNSLIHLDQSLSISACHFVRGNRDNLFRDQLVDPDQNLHANPVQLKSAIREHQLKSGPSSQKILRVSILGIPNSGKSTLVNALTGVCARPVSKKVHTTRFNARAILTDSNTQICFTDTPGVVSKEEIKKFKLNGSLITDPESSGDNTDIFIVLQDISNHRIRESINPEILKILCLYPEIPSVLVLNKLDTVPSSKRIYNLIRKLSLDSLQGEKASTKILKSKEQLIRKHIQPSPKSNKIPDDVIILKGYQGILNLLEAESDPVKKRELIDELVKDLKGWPGFQDVFTISALNGTGVDKLRNYLLENSKTGPHIFPSEIKTDLDSRQLVKDIIKSKFLDSLPFDIPYLLKPVIDYWKLDNEVLRICITVSSFHPRVTSQLLRKHRLREIAVQTEKDLQNFFETDVFVNINVRVLHDKKPVHLNPIHDTSKDIFL